MTAPSPPREPRGCRRYFKWIFGAAIVLFIGVPTVQTFSTRSEIAQLSRSAQSVRLEGFNFKEVLTSRTLAPAEFTKINAAMPYAFDAGVPGLVYFCFDPHHRIVFIDAEKQERRLGVCFSCDQIRISGGAILPTPFAWRGPLRELFLSSGIEIRDHYSTSFDEPGTAATSEDKTAPPHLPAHPLPAPEAP